jgi:DNA-binding IclR family transcriptional regulator
MRTADWTESVSVLDRVSAVLEAFDHDDGLGVSEIARRARLPKSTVSRLVTDLVRRNYLDRDGTRLHLGLRLYELGQAVEEPRLLRHLAYPVMSELRSTTGESVLLAVPDGQDVVLVAVLAGREGTPPVPVGMRLPARSTALGRAILASRPGDQLGAGDEATLIRRSGIARGLDDAAGGQACMASPLAPAGSALVGAIAVVGPAEVVDTQHVGGLVRSAAGVLAGLCRRVSD